MIIYIYISSVYSPFSDGVELPLHNIPSSGGVMKSIGAVLLPFLASTTSVGCNIKMVLNKILCTNLCEQFLYKTATLMYALNRPISQGYILYKESFVQYKYYNSVHSNKESFVQ